MTSDDKWESEAMTMLSQDFFLCTRDGKVFWECIE